MEAETQAFSEQQYPLNHSTAKAFKPDGQFMLARLNLCRGIMKSIDEMPYSDVWDFWQKVEVNWKSKILNIANQRANEPNYTKRQTNDRNRQFKNKLLNKENPYLKEQDPDLFIAIDTALKLIDFKSENSSKDFSIQYWNPLIKSMKTFISSQERGVLLDNGQRTETKTRRLVDGNLVAVMGARKKEAIYSPNSKNISGRGRKKSNNNPCATKFSATLPAEFADDIELNHTEDISE
ncbi:MAG: hypothetical protein AAGE84_30010 [Cyanobacteria bacterium P01_G01_bin.39]